MADLKVFPLSEVSLHSSKKDCWIIVRGKVYDVTGFLEEHPGGEDVLIEASGRDATKEFNEVGHSSTAMAMMDGYEIGIVEGFKLENPPGKAKSSGDHSGISYSQKASTSLVKEEGPSGLASFMQFLLPLVILGVAVAAWYFLNSEKPKSS
ncbi:cytochrome B5 [Amborella trichopoda]|uniref:Cytochrome b5 heme-binding domain-containing protein n=1 Tax=Amborella trichopoda TaxID=13333 RepID=U5DHZ8_AMBTC|nr:cytochrome B5 [Amborella trichopoda]ERN20183.1 hypothetical protein AMTR_s00066p00110400 [Amborella trichopoda]|eukprot:XP_006858716.1 cytochrome B5 [Amborella trichopoda]